MAGGDRQTMTLESMRGLAQTYKTNAGRCKDIGDYLKNQKNGKWWESQAATKFQTNMDTYQRTLLSLNEALTGLGNEVNNRANILENSGNV